MMLGKTRVDKPLTLSVLLEKMRQTKSVGVSGNGLRQTVTSATSDFFVVFMGENVVLGKTVSNECFSWQENRISKGVSTEQHFYKAFSRRPIPTTRRHAPDCKVRWVCRVIQVNIGLRG